MLECPETDNFVEYEVGVGVLEDKIACDRVEGKWYSLVFRKVDQVGNFEEDNQLYRKSNHHLGMKVVKVIYW